MRTILLWLGAIALSVLCIGMLNFFWLQGILALMQARPLPQEATVIMIHYLHWLFSGFDAIVLYLFLMRFHDAKRNLADLAIMQAVMAVLLYIGTTAFITKFVIVGFWIPFFLSIEFFTP